MREGRRNIHRQAIDTMRDAIVAAGDPDHLAVAMAETVILSLQDGQGRLRKPSGGRNRRRAYITARLGYHALHRLREDELAGYFGAAAERLADPTTALGENTMAALDQATGGAGEEPIKVKGTDYNAEPIHVELPDATRKIVPAGDVKFALDRAGPDNPQR